MQKFKLGCYIYPCIVSFYTGNIANLAGYPPLTKNIFFVKHLLDHNIYIEYIFVSTAKQWNQEKISVKHKLGKHQSVHRRKILRSGGLQAVGRPAQYP